MSDLAWLSENTHVFWPAAQQQYQEQGRGAIVVDTTVQPVEGKGNPFAYFPQEGIEKGDDVDVQRMVTLLKRKDRVSSYRVQIRPPGGSD